MNNSLKETLELFESVFYIDSSVRLYSSEISSTINGLKEIGIIGKFIPLSLVCYTNPKMFDWFKLKVTEYSEAFILDANILLFKRTFLTALIMKAWVTCALNPNCITPPGSQLYNCCGCHRYDQDALTIITSYFFVHPFNPDKNNITYSPFGFRKNEDFFHKVNRGESMSYFTPKP
jgi:hypothetical protein